MSPASNGAGPIEKITQPTYTKGGFIIFTMKLSDGVRYSSSYGVIGPMPESANGYRVAEHS